MTPIRPEVLAKVRYLVLTPRFRPTKEQADAHLLGMLYLLGR
jgi:hypothetical protein